MAFQLKSFPQIMRDMIAVFLANTPINDINRGSVISTFLEAAATEDFNQYFQMLAIISNFYLDNITGEDLDKRAIEYGLDGRIQPSKAFSKVTISDSAFTKISTKLYAGLAGPVSGQSQIYVDSASLFTSTGDIIIGRGTINVERRTYSSVVIGLNYSTINLSSPLQFDHGTDETVILAQGGDRVIGAGTIVKVPASDFNPDIKFTTNYETTILDGEDKYENIDITAVTAGTDSNVPANSVQSFDTKPFPTAVVANPRSITNGIDLESDAALRDRIKSTIQSLSKGTTRAIINGVVGIVDPDDNKRVVSANLIDATNPTDIAKLVIDDGTGFEPSFEGRGFETVVEDATGGEEFIQLDLFPIVKATATTIQEEPFAIQNNMTLIFKVGIIEETITFISSDFRINESGTAQEVVTAINNRSTLVEARTTGAGKKIELKAKVNENEILTIVGGTANAVNILNFPVGIYETLKLYKFDGSKLTILEKDGSTAVLEATNIAPFNFSSSPKTLDVQLDGEIMHTGSAEAGSGLNTIVDSILSTRFLANSDLATKYVTFLSGANIGLSAPISAFNVGTNTITLTGGLTVSTSDAYQIDDVERIFFSNATGEDFINPATASSAEVIAVINKKLKGMASIVPSTSKIRIVSNIENSKDSKIKIHGGTANALLGFSTAEVSGTNKDYTLNRFNGQIQLNSPLLINEQITAGTRLSRGFAISNFPQPYSLTNGDTLSIAVDGGSSQVITFLTADFSDITSASAAEVAAVINRDLVGGTASVTADNKIMIRTNTFIETIGSIEITGATGNAVNMGFSIGVPASSIKPHFAAILSGNTEPFNFSEEDHLVVVLDDDLVNKTFDIKMSLLSEVIATSTPTLSFTAKISALGQNYINKWLLDNEITDMRLIWKTAANIANVGLERNVLTYNATTGVITLDAAMPVAITAADTFILIPVTVKNVVDYLKNTSTSTLSLFADVEAADEGTKVQIATKTDGGAGYVNVTGGSGNGLESTFYQNPVGNFVYVENALWAIGMDVSVDDDDSSPLITTVVGVTPNDPVAGVYKIELAGSPTPYTIAQNALMTRLNVLAFDTAPIQGIDSYKYSTGLLRRVQRTVDGLDQDQSFPGIKAAGVQVEVTAPVVQKLRFEIDITLSQGVALSAVIDDVKNAVSSYVNSTKVGEDIVLQEIVKRIKLVNGIYDLEITTPLANIAIADNEIARVNDTDIVIG